MKTKLPQSWQEVELGDVTEIFNGKTPSETEKREQGTPILKIKDVNAGGYFKGSFDSFVDLEFYNKYSEKVIKKGDTLILNAAHNSEYVGTKTFFVENLPENTLATGEWLIIRANPKFLDTKFKHFVMTSSFIRTKIKEIVKGIHLYPKDVKLIKLLLPPLQVQKQIVSILEKAEALKQKREEADRFTQEYLQSVFYEMFYNKGFEEVELGEVCEIKKGSSITKDKITPGRVPVIAGGQQPAYYHNIPNRTGETITVSGSGAYAGFVAYFNISLFASDCSTIQPKTKNLIGLYIYYFLKSKQKSIYDLQKGIAQPHVYPKDLAIIEIPIPPLSLQQKFASIVEHVEKLKEKQKQSKEEINIMFDSLMKQAFNGELVR